MKHFIPILLLLLFTCSSLLAQRQISGKVIDEFGGPLPGVNILVQGTTTGTVTDVEGNYSLGIPGNGGILVFSFVGYISEEVMVGSQSIINLTMTPDIATLSEIVVVGYGEQRKSDLIGAVSQIESKSIQELPITTFDQALTGQVAGVQTRQTGRPGGGPEVLIRGISSVGANNAPLYVIDGFPVGNAGAGDDQKDNFNLNWLAPENIESISVLKDASAKAIYGSRASSGVVIITTRKGKKGAPRISFSTKMGLQEIPQYEKPDVLNATELAQFLREVEEDRLVTRGEFQVGEPIPDEAISERLRNPAQYGEGVDWYDEITRTGTFQNYNINLNGGTDNISYNISGGYFRQEGVVIETEFERYSFNAKIDAKIADRIRYGFNLAPSYVLNQAGNTDPNEDSGFGVYGSVLSSAWADPSGSVYKPGGELNNNTGNVLLPNGLNASPVAQQRLRVDERRSLALLFGNYLEIDVLENLTAKTFFAFNFNDRRVNNFLPSVIPGGNLPANPEGTGVAEAQLIEETRRNWVWENTLRYNKTFNDVHNFDFLTGLTLEKREFESSRITAKNIIEEQFILPTNPNVSQDDVNNFTGRSNFSDNSLVSLLARVNYTYADRYYLTATIRRDGSSRFGADNRFGNFPALAAAWRISNESFYPEGLRRIISDLKVEVAWGLSGNNAIGNYQAQGNVGQVNYVFGLNDGVRDLVTEAPGSVIEGLPNPTVTWEETEQWDIGIDIGLLTNRLNLSIDLYNTLSKDFLIEADVPVTTGFAGIITNEGSIRNKGIEIELSTNDLVRSGDFSYDFNLNFTRNINEVEELLTDRLLRGGAGNGTQFTITEEGEPVGMYRGLVLDGLFSEEDINDPNVPKYPGAVVGSVKYLDISGDGRLGREEDYAVIGNPHPDFIFGIRHNFRYKAFDLSILMNGMVGHDIFDLSKQNLESFEQIFNIRRSFVEARYRPGDDIASKTVPIATVDNAQWRWPNTRSIHDGDYLLVRNITLGYDFTNVLRDKKLFRAARAYLSVQNPFLFTGFEFGNPEIGRAGDNALVRNVFQGSYPNVRIYTLGLNVTF